MEKESLGDIGLDSGEFICLNEIFLKDRMKVIGIRNK
jgi:hypothetical protein